MTWVVSAISARHRAQSAERRARVNGADAAWVTRAPGLEEIERFGATHLPDRNAIGAQAQR